MSLTTADPIGLILFLSALTLAPFAAVMVSSFVKIVVIFNLIRNALGIQQIPPNMVLNGLAIVMSIYVMTPVIQDSYDILKDVDFENKDIPTSIATLATAKEPLQDFLFRHSREKERRFFMQTAKRIWPEGRADNLTNTDFMVLIPAFTISELTSAFEIGFLIYLPFIAIDLITSNILLALGMMMVSPMTISLPFKLLLFVLVEGWSRLTHGILLTYR
tara:strand:+ start:22041 stop:22694 length:654 start_codon:yes stop_codon:yes gene_type:complete